MTKAGIQSLFSAELSPPVATGSVKQAEQNSPGTGAILRLLAGFSEGDYMAISTFRRTLRTCLSKRDEKFINNQQGQQGPAFYFLNLPKEYETPSI